MQRAFSRWLRWLATAQVIALLVTMAIPAAAASTSSVPEAQLIQVLTSYGVVKGDPSGNFNLDKAISRAEMITIMVRARGGESESDMYKDYVGFPDAMGHWAQGYIAWARIKGLVKGDGTGNVRPQDPITYAEALTMVLRVVGKEPTTGTWPINVILEAADIGIVPEGITAATINQPAVRGQIFSSLAKSLTTVKNAEGKTYLQAYLDQAPPALTVTDLPATTKDDAVKVAGSVKDAVSLTVNGKTVPALEQFSTDVALAFGSNTITIVATDLAGNQSTKTLTITRVPKVASLEIAGPAKVKPSGTATYVVSGKDGNGQPASLDGVTAKVEGNVGTFDLKTGLFTAAAKAAKGSITVSAGSVSKSISVEVMGNDPSATKLMIRSVNSGVAVSYTKPMTVQVEVQDNNSQTLTNDYGRGISLAANGLAGVTVTPAVAYTEAGVATFTVTSTNMGYVSLAATSQGLTPSNTSAQFGSNLRVRLSADPSSLYVGGTAQLARIRGTLVDENGQTVVNRTDSDLYVRVGYNGVSGTIVDDTLHISRGASSSTESGDDALYSVGIVGGTVLITGTVFAGSPLTVDATSVAVSTPTIGYNTTWDVLGQTSLTPGSSSPFLVRLADGSGNTISGSWAFQLRVTTSNNEPKIVGTGIPSGVTLSFGSRGWNPVTDDIAESTVNDGNDVTIRTTNGTASFQINYNKPGKVYVTVVPVAATNSAYGADEQPGAAASPIGVPERTFTFTFAGTASKVKLEVDSALGTGLSHGAVAANAGRSFTLRAILTDNSYNWVPNSTANVTLSAAGSCTIPVGNTTVAAVDGKATFTINAGTTSCTSPDSYTVTAAVPGGDQTSNAVTLNVQSAAPAAPLIPAARGVNNSVPGSLYYVASTDTGLEIEIQPADSNQRWAIAKVYTENGYTPIYTSGLLNLTSPAQRITVPKSVLLTGISRYQVTLVNGYGESSRTTLSSPVTNSLVVENLTISGAKWQRSTRTLTVYGSGFGTASDVVRPGLMTLRDASVGSSVSLAGAQVTVNGWNQLTFNLASSSLDGTVATLDTFGGTDVRLTASEGWYQRANGEQASANTNGVQVGPFARITSVTLDRTNNRLYLNGEGFTSGAIDFSKLKLQSSGRSDITLISYTNGRNRDDLWTVNLDTNAVNALTAANYTLTVADAWFYDSSWNQPSMTSLPVYTQVQIDNVVYDITNNTLTIKGSGFAGGSVAPNKSKVHDGANPATVDHVLGAGTVVDDSTITFSIGSDTLDTFGTLSANYFITDAGWFTDSLGRPAAAIPNLTYRLGYTN